MLILQTAHTFAPEVNGVSEVVQQLSKRLAWRGHEIHVATAATANAPAEEVMDAVTVHRFGVRGNLVFGIGGDAEGYVRFVRSHPWDVVVMHCGQIWSTDSLLPVLPALQSKKLFVAHGLSAFSDPRYASYFPVLAEAVKYVDAFVGLSPLTEENDFARRFDLVMPRLIPNGVAIENFRGEALGLRKKWHIGARPWLLSVGNHVPQKGHNNFFALLHNFRRHRPEVIGTIIGGNHAAAKWRLGELGINGGCWYRCHMRSISSPNLQLRSGVPRLEVISAFQEADLTVVTSNWEASPLIVLESMAAGTPWVSFDVGCVRNHAGGMVVGSVPEMAKTVLDLLDDPARRRQLGHEGRAQIVRSHDWELITDQYERLFHGLVQNSRGAAAKTATTCYAESANRGR
jgi:glycosyltransferase involved in cell wall biosynthesis